VNPHVYTRSSEMALKIPTKCVRNEVRKTDRIIKVKIAIVAFFSAD
jgi:hypothetical protein